MLSFTPSCPLVSVEPFSRSTSFKEEQRLSTPAPMLVTLLGIVMLANLLQLSNTKSPMLVTPSGMLMLVKPVHL